MNRDIRMVGGCNKLCIDLENLFGSIMLILVIFYYRSYYMDNFKLVVVESVFYR